MVLSENKAMSARDDHEPIPQRRPRRTRFLLMALGITTALALLVALLYFTLRRHDPSTLAPLPNAEVRLTLATMQVGQDLVFPKVTAVKISSRCKVVFATETRARIETRSNTWARWYLIGGKVTVANTSGAAFQNEFQAGHWVFREAGTQYTISSEPLRLEVEVQSGSLRASNTVKGTVITLPAGSRRLLPIGDDLLVP